MPAPVVVKFATAGAKEVEAVFGSLTKKMQAFGRAQAASASRAAQASTAATSNSAKQMEKIRERTATMAGQHAKRAAKAEATAAKQAAKAVETEAKRVNKIRERSAIMAGQYAKKAAAAEIAAAKAANAERAKLGRRGAAVGSTVMGGVRRASGTVTGAAGMLGAGVGVAAIGSGINEAYKLNRRGVLLSNYTQMPGATAKSPEELIGAARGIAKSTGVSAEDIFKSMEVVTARGGGVTGLEKYMQDMGELTKLSVSAGVEMEDMGAVVAAALNAGVGPGDDMLGLVRSLIVQGKAGSIEFRDFADELGRLGGAGNKFGSGKRMLQDVGGLSQIAAVTSGGNVQGARTTVIDMLREFTMGPKIAMLGSMGVQVNKADGFTRNPQDLMADTINAIESGNIPDKIPGVSPAQRKNMSDADLKAAAYSSIFTGRSADIAGELRKTYNEGYTPTYGANAGKKFTGSEAVRARIESASRPYEMTAEKAATEYAAMEKTMALAKAHEEFKSKMAELLPEVAKLIPMLVKAADGFARLVVWLGKNPLQGLGAVLSAAMSREIAAAAMNKTIEAGFANIFNSIVGGKGSGGIVGALGALGTIALTAGVVYLTATAGLDKLFETGAGAGQGGLAAELSSIATQREAKRVLASGETTPEQRARLVKKLDEEAAAARTAANTMTGGKFGGGTNVDAGMLLAGSTGGGISTLFAGLAEMLVSKTAEQQGTNAESLKEVEARSNELATSLANLKTAADAAASGGTLASPGAGPRTTPASRAGLKP